MTEPTFDDLAQRCENEAKGWVTIKHANLFNQCAAALRRAQDVREETLQKVIDHCEKITFTSDYHFDPSGQYCAGANAGVRTCIETIRAMIVARALLSKSAQAEGETPNFVCVICKKRADGFVGKESYCFKHGWENTNPARAREKEEEIPSSTTIPDEISEWIFHMDMHLTEHDTHHAGLALRAAWPTVRDFFQARITELERMNKEK